MKKRSKEILNQRPKTVGAFITQPISQPDSRQPETGVALPNEENVLLNKIWVDENGKS